MASLVYALVSAVLLIIVKELNLKYMKKIRMPIPMEIIIVSDAQAVPWTLRDTVPPLILQPWDAHVCSQRAHHVKHPHSEDAVTPTWLGVRSWAVLTEETSDAQPVPIRLYPHPGDAEDEEHNSHWGGSLLS